MQRLSTHDVNQISGGLTGLQTLGLIVTAPITIPLSLLSSVIIIPGIFAGASSKLGSNIADYYSGWDQVTGWHKPSNQG